MMIEGVMPVPVRPSHPYVSSMAALVRYRHSNDIECSPSAATGRAVAAGWHWLGHGDLEVGHVTISIPWPGLQLVQRHAEFMGLQRSAVSQQAGIPCARAMSSLDMEVGRVRLATTPSPSPAARFVRYHQVASTNNGTPSHKETSIHQAHYSGTRP